MGPLKNSRLNSNRVPERSKELLITQSLGRDLDGYVHTPAGFLPPEQYRKVRAENPSAGLPDYDEIPLLES